MPVGEGVGVALTFGTSSFTANIVSIDGEDISREPINTTHLGTAGYKTSIPASLVDPGGFSFEMQFDADNEPPHSGAAETITIQFPVIGTGTTGASIAGTGFMTAFNFSIPEEGLMTASGTIKWDGETGPTWTDQV